MATKKQNESSRNIPWRWILNGVVVVALGYIIYSQWSQFGGSLSHIKGADPLLVLLAFGAIFSTYALAAFQYKFLAIQPIRFLPTWVVQLAGAMANRILPGGLGGLGLSADYLHRNKHTLGEAGVVAGTNNLLGMVMHVSFISILIIFGSEVRDFTVPPIPTNLLIAITIAIGLAAISLVVFPAARRWMHIIAKDIKRSAAYYKDHMWRLGCAAIIAVCVSACFIVALQLSGLALGITHLTFSQYAIIMTLGVLVGTATPTPGGVVGAEAGLAAGLIAYGVPQVEAIAVAILYRVVSYWIPLVFGAVFFVYAQKKQYI